MRYDVQFSYGIYDELIRGQCDAVMATWISRMTKMHNAVDVYVKQLRNGRLAVKCRVYGVGRTLKSYQYCTSFVRLKSPMTAEQIDGILARKILEMLRDDGNK